MAEINVRNILVGYGDLFVAENPTGDAETQPTHENNLPDFDVFNSLNDAFTDAADWDYLGATQEGVELAYEPEYGEVEVDQFGDAAVMFFERASVSLNTQLAEATLENLIVAWGFEDSFLESAQDTDTFSLGIQDGSPVERSVAVTGKGAAADDGSRRERLYLGRRVLSVEGSSLALRRSENTAYPVTFRLLGHPEFAGAEYGQIIDRLPGEEVT